MLEVVDIAGKERKIDKKLRAIAEAWSMLTLKFTVYKDTDTQVLVSPDEIVENLEEHQLQLQTMAGMGKFVDFFRDKVNRWQRKLGNIETSLKLWLGVQRQWESLESIFLSSADIRAQLPEDTKRFEGIDQEFKDLMADAVTDPVALKSCTRGGREESLISMAGGCSKGPRGERMRRLVGSHSLLSSIAYAHITQGTSKNAKSHSTSTSTRRRIFSLASSLSPTRRFWIS